MSTFLDSPVLRISIGQMCNSAKAFRFESLLRWGHAKESWKYNDGMDISEAGLVFIRKFNLVSEWRRVAEMFCHFAEARLYDLVEETEEVCFASDGLLLSGVARCKIRPGADTNQDISRILQELRVFQFPIAAVNRINNDTIEIAAFHCPVHNLAEGENRLFCTSIVRNLPEQSIRAKRRMRTKKTHSLWRRPDEKRNET